MTDLTRRSFGLLAGLVSVPWKGIRQHRPNAPVLHQPVDGKLSWLKPLSGSSPITGYNVYIDGLLV